MPLPNPRHIETGNEKELHIRCSEESRKAIKKMLNDIDPDMSHEEALLQIYKQYYQNPSKFQP